ncbi:SRPBCC family protein [Microbacterium sp. BLY]|uniref:SRPBCC family protein n=1 Tax=Microbacterium sp. BLY TaxID=2823280 RepID=UPI001B3391DE|nr:SRPBCC family protein [Microbacterium sp. BLY]MBP3976934.1 SRPBCC family protein [Microbacterium sp. BLY]
MSRFTQAAATMHTLSLAAMEEASRLGVRDADIDHLLLALTLDADLGGQVLRRAGVHLDAARAAVEAQHAGQLQAVGVDAPSLGPGRIVFHETDGYDWTDRALAVLTAASSGGRRGDSAAVLRALLAEPSGLIAAILRRLAVTADGLAADLDEVEAVAGSARPPHRASGITGTRSMFVPATGADVWALVSTAERLPEWEQSVESVHPGPADGPWEAFAPTTAPDGRPLTRKPSLARMRVTRVERQEPVRVAWRFEHPDVPRGNPRLLSLELEPAAGGTQLRATLTWETRPRGWFLRMLRAPLRPLLRGLVFIQLGQVESGISRVFR